ncbi:hypothetical protein BaRGS_00012205 [Batillaria attramentaria]|uniref:Uncharacterized protein n=1 Tax=Batillaria attramentaria TaxID=370345 RepID=A0ABD0LB04_9CAEN
MSLQKKVGCLGARYSMHSNGTHSRALICEKSLDDSYAAIVCNAASNRRAVLIKAPFSALTMSEIIRFIPLPPDPLRGARLLISLHGLINNCFLDYYQVGILTKLIIKPCRPVADTAYLDCVTAT